MESNTKFENDSADLECICGDDLSCVFECPECTVPLSALLKMIKAQENEQEVKKEQESSTNHN